MSTPLLSLESVSVSYGRISAVREVSLEVAAGEIVTLIGANGAGKSSILRAISGVVPCEGRVRFDGRDLGAVPAHRRVGLGLAQVPEGRGIFSNLTVEENLILATWSLRPRRRAFTAATRGGLGGGPGNGLGSGPGRDPGTDPDSGLGSGLGRVYTLFPRLRERARQPAGTLSGGEQQMLAVGRTLMTGARCLLLDEPSMGLSPILTQEIFRVLREINQTGATLLLVEQNAHLALRLASRAYVLQNGRVELHGPCATLASDPRIREAYLGG